MLIEPKYLPCEPFEPVACDGRAGTFADGYPESRAGQLIGADIKPYRPPSGGLAAGQYGSKLVIGA